jgi:class 3 adenylate cyclase
VLFCDLVGSTTLASRLDPGDLREIIGVFHRCVADTIARFDDFVAKYMGDGVGKPTTSGRSRGQS